MARVLRTAAIADSTRLHALQITIAIQQAFGYVDVLKCFLFAM